FLSDCQRQLLVLDDHFHHSFRIVYDRNALDLRRTDGVGHEDDWVFRPLDDVDLFTAEFPDDRLDARTLHPDAGPDGIDVALARIDCDLGAIAGFPHGAADHNGAVVNFRYFLLEQFDQQGRVGARQD